MEIITEKNYPIRNIWIYRSAIFALALSPVFLLIWVFFYKSVLVFSVDFLIVFAPMLAFIFLILFVPIVVNLIRRSNFHYSLEANFMVFRQGVISKQNLTVPYGRVQGVFINQNLPDRIFGLASITIEDFSGGGISRMNIDGEVRVGKTTQEFMGFLGNLIHIPGLKKSDAEAVKEFILNKTKDNSTNDSSGL
jgi:membrane protein YdbS with pleckstrin-like domain